MIIKRISFLSALLLLCWWPSPVTRHVSAARTPDPLYLFIEVEAKVAFTHPPDGELKRLRPLFDGPSRTQRRQALEHVVFEVVGVHRRLLAHCRCNGALQAGLQAAEAEGDAP